MSYRGLRFFALLFMSLSQYCGIALLFNKLSQLGAGETLFSGPALTLLQFGRLTGNLTFPLLLVASLAIVLNGEENFVRMLVSYFILALGTYLFTVLLLTNMIISMASSIPRIASEITDIKQLGEILLRDLLKQMLPGDGTIHWELLNNLLAGLGIKGSVTDWLEKLSALPYFSSLGAGNVENLISQAETYLTSMDVDTAVNTVIAWIEKAIDNINWETLWVSLRPHVQSWLATNLHINVFWDLFNCSLLYFFVSYTPKKLHGGKLLLFRCAAVLPAAWMLTSVVLIGNMKSIQSFTLPQWVTALFTSRNIPSVLIFLLMLLFLKYHEEEHRYHGGTAVQWKNELASPRMATRFSVFICICVAILSAIDSLFSGSSNLAKWHIGTSGGMWMAIPFLMLFSFNKKPKHQWTQFLVPVYYVLHYAILVILAFALLRLGPTLLQKLIPSVP